MLIYSLSHFSSDTWDTYDTWELDARAEYFPKSPWKMLLRGMVLRETVSLGLRKVWICWLQTPEERRWFLWCLARVWRPVRTCQGEPSHILISVLSVAAQQWVSRQTPGCMQEDECEGISASLDQSSLCRNLKPLIFWLMGAFIRQRLLVPRGGNSVSTQH